MSESVLASQPIAALATGPGAAAVAIIRISGVGCQKLLLPCLAASAECNWPHRELRLTSVVDPDSRDRIDDVMVVFFQGPRSYTGEDSAEIHCHGGPYVVRRILELL